MRKNFKIILDCDDVLLDCNQYALDTINHAYGWDYGLDDITGWGRLGNALDKRLCLFSDPRFIRSIPPIRGAADFIVKLQEKGEVFVCTSVDPKCAGERISSIIEHFPMIPVENILIGTRKDLLQADVILDDGYHNLKNSNVRYPVLFRKPWNHTITGICAISTFDEFLTLIDILKKGSELTGEKKILALVGPSGTGKSAIADSLIKSAKMDPVVTYTTRQPRGDNDRYHFISKQEFLRKKDSGFFLETSSYQGEYYGTHAGDIFSIIKNGKTAVMVLDINGAIAIKRAYKDSLLTVYIKRNKEDCIRSILNRNLSLEETVHRIASLDAEAANEELCDVTIENDSSIEGAISKIKNLL